MLLLLLHRGGSDAGGPEVPVPDPVWMLDFSDAVNSQYLYLLLEEWVM